MQWIHNNLLLLVAASCFGGSGIAADIRVIANPTVKVSAFSPEELKAVFLETRASLSDGGHVEPVLLKTGPLREAFARKYVGKSASALEIYYRSLVFTGKALMPKTVTTEQQAVDYVAKTKGAVGYVSAGAVLAGVHVVDVR